MPAYDSAFLAFLISTLLVLNISANAFIGTIARDLSLCCMFGNKLFRISEIIVGGIRFLQFSLDLQFINVSEMSVFVCIQFY